jgi:hypothetical protein
MLIIARALNNACAVLKANPTAYRDPPALWSTVIGTFLLTFTASMTLDGPEAFVLLMFLLGGGMGLQIGKHKLMRMPAACASADLCRVMFSACVSAWPVIALEAIGLPAEIAFPAALYGFFTLAVQLFRYPPGEAEQVRGPEGLRTEAPRDAAGAFVAMGPAIGSYKGKEIPAFLVDAAGGHHDFVGCLDVLAGPAALAEGQTAIPPGLLYEPRRAGAASTPKH